MWAAHVKLTVGFVNEFAAVARTSVGLLLRTGASAPAVHLGNLTGPIVCMSHCRALSKESKPRLGGTAGLRPKVVRYMRNKSMLSVVDPKSD